MIKKTQSQKNKAVAPVLATLLMIAVAVAMSVIIFMWSQSFLGQTSESTGSQQGSQNQAAQSSIGIESFSFSSEIGTLYYRNVGGIAITPALVIATGITSNTGFSGVATNTTNLSSGLAKGAGGTTTVSLPSLKSGDVITVKITTTAGTFAQATYTVP